MMKKLFHGIIVNTLVLLLSDIRFLKFRKYIKDLPGGKLVSGIVKRILFPNHNIRRSVYDLLVNAFQNLGIFQGGRFLIQDISSLQKNVV